MRFSKGILSLFEQDAITSVFQIILSVYIARQLGPSQLGILVILMLIIQCGDKFGRLKLEDAAIYLMKKDQCRLRQANIHLFWLSIPQFILTVGLLIAFAKPIQTLLFKNDSVPALYYALTLAHIPLIFLLMNIRKLSMAVQEISLYNKTFWMIPLIQIIVLAGIALSDYPLHLGWVLGASLLAHFAVIVMGQYRIWQMEPTLAHENSLDAKLIKNLFHWGVQFYISALPGFLQLRLDLLLIAYFLEPNAAAFYSLATTASELLWKLPNAVQNLFFPVSASMSSPDANQFAINTCRRLLVPLCLTALAGALGIYPAVYLFYGASFLPVVSIFWFLLPGTIAFGLTKVLVSYFYGRGLAIKVFWITSAACTANFLLNVTCIPLWKTHGAACASTITYLFTTMSLMILLLRQAEKNWQAFLPTREDFIFYPTRIKELLEGKS